MNEKFDIKPRSNFSQEEKLLYNIIQEIRELKKEIMYLNVRVEKEEKEEPKKTYKCNRCGKEHETKGGMLACAKKHKKEGKKK